MKKFAFTLKPLYTMKENAEKQIKMRLKTIEAELAACAQELASLNDQYALVKTEFVDAVVLGIEAAHAMQFGEYLLKLKTAMSQTEARRQRIEQKKTVCLAELVDIRKEKKMIEKLRQSEYEQYLYATKKEHNKIVDDFFSYKVSVS